MILYLTTWVQLAVDRRAVTALEYGLLAGIIAATIMGGFHLLADSLSAKFSAIGAAL